MQKTNHDKSEVVVDENGMHQHAEEAAKQAALQDEDTQETEGMNDPEAQEPVSAVDGELAVLRAKLEEKETEVKANYELFLRERAELENFKRRMQREKSEALRFANEPLFRDLLPVVDNLERATAHAQEGGNGQSLIEGVTLVLRSFLDVLEKHGVTRVSAKGEPFDPTKHEAMAQVESDEMPPNMVVDEHAPGYSLHDRLLRAAMVSVSKAPAASVEGATQNGQNEQNGEEGQQKKSED